MAFEKGCSGNPEGRPSGAINKTSHQLRETIADFLEQNFEKVVQDFNKLKPKDRAKLYCDLLQYGLPRLQSIHLPASDNKKVLIVVRDVNKVKFC